MVHIYQNSKEKSSVCIALWETAKISLYIYVLHGMGKELLHLELRG